MSFYLMLSSEGSKSTYPNNQGGDFKIMLDNALDMKSEQWEVALVEMSYSGQTFPNMSTEDSSITIQRWGKPEFENDYIITYEQTYDLWVQFTLKPIYGFVVTVKTLKVEFPRQHYSWTSFKEYFKRYYGSNKFGDNWPTFISLKDSLFTFSMLRENLEEMFDVQFSPSFVTYFNIKLEDIKVRYENEHDKRLIHLDVPVIKPMIMEDTSLLIHTPYCIYKDVHFKVGWKRYLTLGSNEYWTLNMLKRALDGISANEVNEGGDNNDLKSISIVGERELIVEIANNDTNLKEGRLVKITFSDGFMAALGIRNKNTEIKSIHRYRTQIEPVSCRERSDLTWPIMNLNTKEMSQKYYPNVSSLVAEINKVIIAALLELSIKCGTHEMFVDFFTLDDDESTNIVTYHKKHNVKLQLSTELLSLLNLDSNKGWLSETCQGSKAVELKPYNRPHFYVHCDCIDYYYINNNVSHLIKIVNNNAKVNEKIVQSFNFPNYYVVTRRIMSNINMYITDNLFDNILEFD